MSEQEKLGICKSVCGLGKSCMDGVLLHSKFRGIFVDDSTTGETYFTQNPFISVLECASSQGFVFESEVIGENIVYSRAESK